jgi:site-specific DNA recombinase
MQSLVADAASDKLDFVYAEALDRISRDQEDVAGFYKRLRYANVRIICQSASNFDSDSHFGCRASICLQEMIRVQGLSG